MVHRMYLNNNSEQGGNKGDREPSEEGRRPHVLLRRRVSLQRSLRAPPRPAPLQRRLRAPPHCSVVCAPRRSPPRHRHRRGGSLNTDTSTELQENTDVARPGDLILRHGD